MGTWATAASLFIAGLLWLEVESKPQLFQQPQQNRHGFYYLPTAVAQSHSALGVQPQHRFTQVDYPPRVVRYEQNNIFDGGNDLYKNFEQHFETNLDQTRPQTFPPTLSADDRNGYDTQNLGNANEYDDHKTSQTTNLLGPYQIENIDSEHYHKQVPAFDISSYQHHHESAKHGEVHYHQHKHIHKHEHKQEHVHQHKQYHQHKHAHNQHHKHDHHSDNKHEHKHQHHQQHKHEHGHDHKHDNHHDHKHQHGHKHHSDNKHHHNHHHGHKHGHKYSKHY